MQPAFDKQAYDDRQRQHMYIGRIVVLRRDNNEPSDAQVDRVLDADDGMVLLEHGGWTIPSDVLFVVHENFSDGVIRDLAQTMRMPYSQVRALPELIRQYRAQDAGPTYKQFQAIPHQPAGDGKPIKITISEVHKTDDGYRYSLKQGRADVAGLFDDGAIRLWIEQGYLPMPEQTTAVDPSEAETRAPEPERIDMTELNRLKKELKAKTKEVSDLVTQNQHFVQQMAAQSKTYDEHLAARNATIDKLAARFESELIGALDRMTRLVQHQGRMLAESASVQQLPMEARTFQQLIPLEQRVEGYASDKALNDLFDDGWTRVHTSDVVESNQIRRVHLLERVKPLQFPSGMAFHLGAPSLADEIAMSGAEAVANRMNAEVQQAIDQRREQNREGKARDESDE